MNYQSVEEILLLHRKFEERTLAKEEWTHAAHLIVALVYCCVYPINKAQKLLSDGIFRLNIKHGTPNNESSGYHETLTVFWLKLVWSFLEMRGRGEDLAILANDLITLLDDPKLPLKYYRREILFSPQARVGYVKPDLPGFPTVEEVFNRKSQNKAPFIPPFFFDYDCPCGLAYVP